ncbi:MAG: glycosyltransferase 87 family protein [Chloroflexota bacterium]
MASTISTDIINRSGIYQSKLASRWIALVPILVLAVLVRVVFINDVLYQGDMDHFAKWVQIIRNEGILKFYTADYRLGAWDRTYPQLFTLTFGAIAAVPEASWSSNDTSHQLLFVELIKAMPLLSELALIVVIYAWLRKQGILAYLVPTLLAIYPGMIVTSAWWGQYEAPFTLFLVLALFALNKDRPILAWISFSIAILFKQPGVALGPLLLVLSYRRYGLRPTLIGMALCAAICIVIITPFAVVTGIVDALASYLNAGDAFPFMTNNAYNFWYAVASLHKGAELKVFEPAYKDAFQIIGPLTAKYAGLFLFAVFVLLIVVLVWRNAHQKREFVWASAVYLGFFLLPTQVHERYLYTAGVLTLVAIAQDRRMWWIALGLMWSFSYNVLGVAIPYRWPNLTMWTGYLAVPTALFNVALLIALTRLNLQHKTIEATHD